MACETALKFAEVLERLNQEWKEGGLPPLEVRIGVHTGEMLIGNIGCAERMNYTVCGTAANIASRVEQLGKAYQASPLISGDVFDLVKEEFCCVWLDNVVLQGHKTTVTSVYHLAAPMRKAMPAQLVISDCMNRLSEDWKHRCESEKLAQRIDDAEKMDELGLYSAVFPILRNRCSKRLGASDSFKIMPAAGRSVHAAPQPRQSKLCITSAPTASVHGGNSVHPSTETN
eukprot:m51a1_g671 putative adenylate guanylate cyclase (229) ;mRNA; f:258634-259320